MIEDIFCKIIAGELPAEIVWQDEQVLVIKDIHPQAPVHLLVVPRQHFDGIEDFAETDSAILGHMVRVAHLVAQAQGLKSGYRLIFNEGTDGGKLVPHLHLHLLGGKKLGPKIVS
jgi:histidine triad (HIT) family protein